MLLIKVLPTKKHLKGYLVSSGIFYCTFCKSAFIKRLDAGKRDKSCGSYDCKLKVNRKVKHNGSNSKLYHVWSEIKQRSFNIRYTRYKYYGGRGITICPEWTDKENGFINFREWSLNNGYAEGLWIDRKSNNGNYEPNNCRWVTPKENCNNRRGKKLSLKKANKIRSEYNTNNYTMKILAKKYKVTTSTIQSIIHNRIWINKC